MQTSFRRTLALLSRVYVEWSLPPPLHVMHSEPTSYYNDLCPQSYMNTWIHQICMEWGFTLCIDLSEKCLQNVHVFKTWSPVGGAIWGPVASRGRSLAARNTPLGMGIENWVCPLPVQYLCLVFAVKSWSLGSIL